MQVVFFGFLIGNPVWGVLADKFGREKVKINNASVEQPCSQDCYCIVVHPYLQGCYYVRRLLQPCYHLVPCKQPYHKIVTTL